MQTQPRPWRRRSRPADAAPPAVSVAGRSAQAPLLGRVADGLGRKAAPAPPAAPVCGWIFQTNQLIYVGSSLPQHGFVVVQRPEAALQLGGDKRPLAACPSCLQGAGIQREAVQPLVRPQPSTCRSAASPPADRGMAQPAARAPAAAAGDDHSAGRRPAPARARSVPPAHGAALGQRLEPRQRHEPELEGRLHQLRRPYAV